MVIRAPSSAAAAKSETVRTRSGSPVGQLDQRLGADPFQDSGPGRPGGGDHPNTPVQREAHRRLTHRGARAVDDQQLTRLDAEVVERAPRRLGRHRQRGACSAVTPSLHPDRLGSLMSDQIRQTVPGSSRSPGASDPPTAARGPAGCRGRRSERTAEVVRPVAGRGRPGGHGPVEVLEGPVPPLPRTVHQAHGCQSRRQDRPVGARLLRTISVMGRSSPTRRSVA